MNLDMSEIIEFVLPPKNEYSDNDDGGGGGGGGVGGSEDATYVVLDDVGNEFDDEEFLIVNEEAHENELLLDEEDLSQQLADNCHELLSVPRIKQEGAGGQHYVVTAQQLHELQEMEELVEEAEQEEFNYRNVSMSDTAEPSGSYLLGQKVKAAAAPQDSHNILEDVEEDDDEPVADAKPSDKMLDKFKGPRRYLLFDDLIATIVDFDDDQTPIVKFSMISNPLDEKLPVECGICPDVMHRTKLSRHQKTHLVPGTNRYACIYCTETYRDCKYLAGHARRHMGIRPYVCELCKLYFSTKQDLHVHNQRRHLEKEHICEICGKTFAQHTQLKRHRESTHEKKRRFQCNYCNKAYYKNFSLQEHIRNVHMGKRRMLKCPFCGMQCRDAHKMARHRKQMHLNQDSYVCYLCQEEFTDINYFDAHKRSIQCRSNTRRLNKGQSEDSNSESPEIMIAPDGLLEEEYDEDTGLLVEEQQQQQQQEAVTVNINGNYLAENESQYATIAFDDEDERLLVEHVVTQAEEPEVEEELIDEEQYFAVLEHHHQLQQQAQQAGQDINDGELIYEITLETEDN